MSFKPRTQALRRLLALTAAVLLLPTNASARLLLPSALTGGTMLVCADVIVRLLPTDTELKLGVAAALLGGPVFALIAARLAARGGEA